MPKHYTDLNSYLKNICIEFTFIGLTETWLKKTNLDLYSFNGYNHVCNYRESKMGGGVSLFIKDSITYQCRVDLDIVNEFIECVEGLCNKNLIIGVIYRPPGTDIFNFN